MKGVSARNPPFAWGISWGVSWGISWGIRQPATHRSQACAPRRLPPEGDNLQVGIINQPCAVAASGALSSQSSSSDHARSRKWLQSGGRAHMSEDWRPGAQADRIRNLQLIKPKVEKCMKPDVDAAARERKLNHLAEQLEQEKWTEAASKQKYAELITKELQALDELLETLVAQGLVAESEANLGAGSGSGAREQACAHPCAMLAPSASVRARSDFTCSVAACSGKRGGCDGNGRRHVCAQA